MFGQRALPVQVTDNYQGNEEDSATPPGLMEVGADRKQRYRVFDEMDNFDLVQSVLTTLAEDSTLLDPESGMVIWGESGDSEVQKEIMQCLENVKANQRAFQTARSLCKYGDINYRLIYETGKGVLGMRFVHPTKVDRITDLTDRVVGYKEDTVSEYRGSLKRPVSWPWDYVHGRLMGGKHDATGYGTSISEPMFRPWRQMTVSEDSMLMFRVGRVGTRMLVQVNTGSMQEHDARALVRSFEKKFRKNEFIDPASGTYAKTFNPLSPMEDVFLAMSTEREHRVDQLIGSGDVGEIHDVEYYVSKFFGSTGAPKAFYGFDDGGDGGKARLTQQSIRWASSGKRVQAATIAMYRQIIDIHFALRGKELHEKAVKSGYVLHMTPISFLDEVERMELLSTRYTLVEQLVRFAEDLHMDVRVWAAYILMRYAHLPEELVLRLLQSKDTTPTAESLAEMSPKEKREAQYVRQEVKLLAPSEMKLMDEVFGKSAMLQHVVEQFTESRGIHTLTLVERGRLQSEPSTLPPVEGVTILVEGDEEAKKLAEDLTILLETQNKEGK